MNADAAVDAGDAIPVSRFRGGRTLDGDHADAGAGGELVLEPQHRVRHCPLRGRPVGEDLQRTHGDGADPAGDPAATHDRNRLPQGVDADATREEEIDRLWRARREDAGIFSAGTPQAVDLFFTRRIGIDTLGQPVPIVGGGRVTGRVGAVTVGALQIFTDRATTQGAMSYSVLRLQHELAARSRIGVIAIQRTATAKSGDWNRVTGVDGRIGIHDALTIDWWGAASAAPGRDRDASAFSARLAYQTGSWNNLARIIQVGRDFDP